MDRSNGKNKVDFYCETELTLIEPKRPKGSEPREIQSDKGE